MATNRQILMQIPLICMRYLECLDLKGFNFSNDQIEKWEKLQQF